MSLFWFLKVLTALLSRLVKEDCILFRKKVKCYRTSPNKYSGTCFELNQHFNILTSSNEKIVQKEREAQIPMGSYPGVLAIIVCIVEKLHGPIISGLYGCSCCFLKLLVSSLLVSVMSLIVICISISRGGSGRCD